MRWTVLIPMKALPDAKTRLVTTGADRGLVDAIRADTISAAAACTEVERVVLVVDQASASVPWAHGADEVFVQQTPGLNAALTEAADEAARRWPADGVAALLGDLPALRPSELADALRIASALRRAFVADSTGLGTTLLTALPGVALDPEFGAGSAARHAASASALPGAAGLRQDVDTQQDLILALEIGVGSATAAATELLSLHAVHLDSA